MSNEPKKRPTIENGQALLKIALEKDLTASDIVQKLLTLKPGIYLGEVK